ncbi:unnamed protein product [Enterobius vermicularis]|uniref:Complex I subunit B13 n=1 Tax=Enterobius vermicularis TaxID=51028 RepID=A0A0N4VL15_ENTVE|nr:unnamed protein product [Enterobius vermicularis]
MSSFVAALRPFSHSLCKTSTRTHIMYKNPYITRFKERSKVSPDHFKKGTGLTGLFVNEHPHHSLNVVYGRILRILQSMPESAAYRKYTEEIVKRRLALVEQEPDIQKLEEKIGMGQIEEVIQQAEYELQAARAILQSKAWEPLVEKPPEDQWKWPIV